MAGDRAEQTEERSHTGDGRHAAETGPQVDDRHVELSTHGLVDPLHDDSFGLTVTLQGFELL